MQDKLKLLKEFLTWRNFNLGEKILFIYLMTFFIICFMAFNTITHNIINKYIIALYAPMLLFCLLSELIMITYIVFYLIFAEIIIFVLMEILYYKEETNNHNHSMRLFFCVIFQIITYSIYIYIMKENPFSQPAYVFYAEFSIMIILTNPFTLHRIIHIKEGSSNA